MTSTVLDLVGGRHGHFQLESGFHSAQWFDLDALFANPQAIAPLADDLADRLRRYDASAVCGPLLGGAFLAQRIAQRLGNEFWYTEREMPVERPGFFQMQYHLPRALRLRAQGQRVAIVDDVMSAGSALRGTHVELQAHEAITVVVGALLVLGSTGDEFFSQQGVPVEAVTRAAYQIWSPDQCPLCASGVPLEVAAGR